MEVGRFTGTDPDDGKTHDEDDISAVPPPAAEPQAVVTGPAAELDAWLWRRGDASDITITGADDVVAHFAPAWTTRSTEPGPAQGGRCGGWARRADSAPRGGQDAPTPAPRGGTRRADSAPPRRTRRADSAPRGGRRRADSCTGPGWVDR